MQTLMNHLCNLIHLMYYTTSNIANLAGNKLVLSLKKTLSLFITNATLNTDENEIKLDTACNESRKNWSIHDTQKSEKVKWIQRQQRNSQRQTMQHRKHIVWLLADLSQHHQTNRKGTMKVLEQYNSIQPPVPMFDTIYNPSGHCNW